MALSGDFYQFQIQNEAGKVALSATEIQPIRELVCSNKLKVFQFHQLKTPFAFKFLAYLSLQLLNSIVSSPFEIVSGI